MAGVSLTPEQFSGFIKLLKDFVKTENERRALIQRAFTGEPIVNKLDYTGSPVTFCSNALDRLFAYDRETAIIRLLETVRDDELGPSRKPEADALIRQLAPETAGVPPSSHPMPGTASAPASTGARWFISYARADIDFVKRLRADFDGHGIPYWIDKVGLVPGTADWEEGLRAAIAESHGLVLVATPDSRKSAYVRDEIAIAQMHHKPIFPLWAGGAHVIDSVPVGLGFVQNIDMRGDAYAAGIVELIAVLDGTPGDGEMTPPSFPLSAGTVLQNPYKGLFAFVEEDAPKFFGRTAMIEEMTRQLKAQITAGSGRFLAVMGPSGAGKSSVVKAGLIPALKRGALPGSADWTYLPSIVPGAHPIEYLADALKTRMPDTPLNSIEADLNAPGGRMLHRLTRLLPGERVVLYIDQFEELFTLTVGEREREQFVSLISQGVSENDGKLVVLLSMRADFLGYTLNYPLLGDLFNACSVLVKPLTIAELYDAIEQPARLPSAGLTFDPGLVAEIVYALRHRDDQALAGALPLLQFTLDRLFEAREGTHLTWTAYKAMGGVSGAIGTHSEAVFTALPEAAQAKLGQVFTQIVSIDESSGEPTRRRAPLTTVTADPDARTLVEALVEKRLLQTGMDKSLPGAGSKEEAYLEIAHEALLRNWDRLVNWVAQAKEDLILQRQVRIAAEEWARNGKPNYLFWNTERLTPVYEMQNRRNPTWSTVEREFLTPEFERLIREVEDPTTPQLRREVIAARLMELGGLPSDFLDAIQWIAARLFDTIDRRRSALTLASIEFNILARINLEGSPITFTVTLFVQLLAYGEQGRLALKAILEDISKQIGSPMREELHNLMAKIDRESFRSLVQFSENYQAVASRTQKKLALVMTELCEAISRSEAILFASESKRKTLLYLVLAGLGQNRDRVFSQIEFEGSTYAFVRRIVPLLNDTIVESGETALQVLIIVLRDDDLTTEQEKRKLTEILDKLSLPSNAE